MEKVLGKIERAEFGQIDGHEFLIGLQLTFTGSFGGIGCGGKFTVNLNERAWENTEEKLGDVLVKQVRFIESLLVDAKVKTISQFKGKPVEVTMENGMFKDFRILTEVL